MKELIARKVDKLGRIVLPKELRDSMKITHDTPLEIYIKDNITIRKYEKKDGTSNAALLRNIDRLGRIVIPKEIRDDQDIKCGDRLKIYLDRNLIIIKKDNCIFCGGENNIIDVLGKNVCAVCLEKIRR